MKFIEPSDDTKKALRIASVSNSQLKFTKNDSSLTITKDIDIVMMESQDNSVIISIEQSKYMAEWLQFDYC